MMKKKFIAILIWFILISSTATLTSTTYSKGIQQINNHFFYSIPETFGRSKVWMKTFGGADSDWGFSVQQTSDGGYIITGFTSSYGIGKTDVWLIKTNKNGHKIWDRTFGGQRMTLVILFSRLMMEDTL